MPTRLVRTFSLVSIALAALITPTPASAQTLAELAMYSGPDRTQRLIAGAKKEGVLNIYSSITVGDMKVRSRASTRNTASRSSPGARAPKASSSAP